MKRIRKIFTFLMTMCLAACLFVGNFFSVQAEQSTGSQNDGEVTRLEWLKALTEAFEMEVEEKNYPDNYYSDVDSSSEDYYDIMLATEFGLVDVEAGDPLRPDDIATREFAAHTLNLCMGYFPEEETGYTFSEASTVTYPDDIQIAINKGWIELSGSDFLPEQGITIAEKDRMIAAAEAAVASVVVDADYDSQYQFAEGVVVVPEGTKVLLTDENELTLYENSVEIAEGDIFIFFSDGFPVARKAVTVATEGNKTVIAVDSVEMEDAFTVLESQGNIGADLTQVQAVSDDVELAYIVGGTEEQAYEDGITLFSLEEVEEQEQEVTAVIATKTIETTDSMRRTYGLASDEFVKVNCKITNVSADYNVSLANGEAYLGVNATVTFSCNLSGEFPLIPSEQDFVKVPIGAIGYFSPELEGSVSGSISLVMKNNVSVGVQWTPYDGGRFVYDFQKESFTIQGQIEGKLGLKLAIGVDVGFLKAELYAKTGVNAYLKLTTYADGNSPEECVHISAHLYASLGGTVKFKLVFVNTTISMEKPLWSEKTVR